MSKSNDQKVEHIIQFITERQDEFTRCADAHKAYMAQHGKVSYVHFNRKFRELCPHLKPTKKVRTLRPKLTAPEPPPKNKGLKDNKRRINYYHSILRDTEKLLETAIEENKDQERILFYRDLRDRDRAAMVKCYEELLDYYEQQIPTEIEEIEVQLHEESIRNGIELDRMFATRTNMLINESDDDRAELAATANLKKAASIVKTTEYQTKPIHQNNEAVLNS
jgi:hypothetical protein